MAAEGPPYSLGQLSEGVYGPLSADLRDQRKSPKMPVDHPTHPVAPVAMLHFRKLSLLTGFVVVLSGLFLLSIVVDFGALLA